MKSTTTKPAKSKLNVRLLRRIKKHILDEPRRFIMYGLVKRGRPGQLYYSDNGRTATYPACGTAACIAGWASILSGVKRPNNTCVAARRIGLNQEWDNALNSTQADNVFYSDLWPEPFRSLYRKAQTTPKRAKIAADRIEHLIATGE